jgi:hypothetical protein
MLPDSDSLEEKTLTLYQQAFAGQMRLFCSAFDSDFALCTAIDSWLCYVTRRPYALDPDLLAR